MGSGAPTEKEITVRTARGRISRMGVKKARDGREFIWIKVILDGARQGTLRHFIAFPYTREGAVCCEGPLTSLRIGLEVCVDYEDGSGGSGFAKRVAIIPKRKPEPEQAPEPEPVPVAEPEPESVREWSASELADELVNIGGIREVPSWEEVRDLLKGDPRMPAGVAIFHKIVYECWYILDRAERN